MQSSSRTVCSPHGEQSRNALLRVALHLFAHQGFNQTSVREIANKAGANIAAISYYFGDKAGLYQAAFVGYCKTPQEAIARFDGPALSLEQALHGFFAHWLEPLQDNDLARDSLLLHFREMLEPTGLWADQITQHIKPLHDALLALLCRHLKAKRADQHITRLALSISALGLNLFVNTDVITALEPKLNGSAAALKAWGQSLVLYASAMIRAEAQRRASLGKPI